MELIQMDLDFMTKSKPIEQVIFDQEYKAMMLRTAKEYKKKFRANIGTTDNSNCPKKVKLSCGRVSN